MQTMTATPQVQPAPTQGLRFDSVKKDGDNWAVKFTAGGERYQYLSMFFFDFLSVWKDGAWMTVTSGDRAQTAVLDVIRSEAGLSIDWPTFCFGYEQFYCGYGSGWIAAEETDRPIIQWGKHTMNILNEHAAFLKALTEIDALLDKMQYVATFEKAMELASQMDDAIPESIVATRKESRK